ncbi:MAG: tetratricopeptide repeat protein [Opitutaceae bacterium]|nr:tetratricopeptide repeat protein [Verrucomicrobiales bacterium]
MTKLAGLLTLLLTLVTIPTHGMEPGVQDLLSQGEAFEQKRETKQAIKVYLAAGKLAPTNSEVLIKLAKQYSDLIFETQLEAEQKKLAERCLDYARRAVEYNPTNARAHLSVAVCLAKNFPYLDNQTKVNYSREVKERSEKAIALDPRQDLAYHMLGRWHFEVADMNGLIKLLMRTFYGTLPKGTFELAALNLKKSVELAPGRVIHRVELARTYLRSGDRKSAIEQLKSSLALMPTDKDDLDAQITAKKMLKELGVKSEASPSQP